MFLSRQAVKQRLASWALASSASRGLRTAARVASQRQHGALSPVFGSSYQQLRFYSRSNHLEASVLLPEYHAHVEERAKEANGLGIAAKPLSAEQVSTLISELKGNDATEAEKKEMIDLLVNRVPPGVDEAAYVKATWLSAIAKGDESCAQIDRKRAIELLGTMQGGYNVATIVEMLNDSDSTISETAAKQLSQTLLVFDALHDVIDLHEKGCKAATVVLESWAKAEWFLNKPEVPEKYTVTVFKVTGETNTDDLSPAQDAWSRPDIPLHAASMLKNTREGIEPVVDGSIGPISQIRKLQKDTGFPLAYVGDVVGTGSSRKSATNSVLWYFGEDIPHVPNLRTGSLCLGGKIAPIFFNTMEDSGALPIELDVSNLNMGDIIDVYPYKGVVNNHATGETITTFELKTQVLLDEVRAGGRIPLIIGRGLTSKAREALGQGTAVDDVFSMPVQPEANVGGFTLAQKMVGAACGLPEGQGVVPGQYCEPRMTSVGSQDTTGPMTRDELRGLACLGFSADLVMQSFCHTAAYPKPVDVVTHHTLPDFIRNRGGVSLRPGDGIIHSWLNRMLLPDTVGTGGDSHTRFPIGISFPAGSGLVAFAAATGIMPLDMPESVLVRFHGEMQPGITLRDLVQSIPYTALKQGLLTTEKKGKKNVFSGRVLEIEGLPDLKCEQAFELSDASAERSAAGCTIQLNEEPIIEYLNSNIVMLKWMISEGYGDARTLERRIKAMEKWVANPVLMKPDKGASYAQVIEIDLNELKEPILALPNDPDASALLSEVAGTHIDEVFIGSCMTNIGHFRAAGKLLNAHAVKKSKILPTRLWVAPPTKMDEAQLVEEGYYSIYGSAGARTEMPGCSLCMGNQARVAPGCTTVSTSTRNFPNRLGQGADVFLASAELAAIASIEGKLPTVEEYMSYMSEINATAADTYRYLNFDELPAFVEKASSVVMSDELKAAASKM